MLIMYLFLYKYNLKNIKNYNIYGVINLFLVMLCIAYRADKNTGCDSHLMCGSGGLFLNNDYIFK